MMNHVHDWCWMHQFDFHIFHLASFLIRLKVFSITPNELTKRINPKSPVLVELNNLNCTSIAALFFCLANVDGQVWACVWLLTQGTNWICVNTRSSKWLPEFPVRDPFRDPRFLRNLFDENNWMCWMTFFSKKSF